MAVGEGVEYSVDVAVYSELGINRNSGESIQLPLPEKGYAHRITVRKEYKVVRGSAAAHSSGGSDCLVPYMYDATCSLQIESIDLLTCEEAATISIIPYVDPDQYPIAFSDYSQIFMIGADVSDVSELQVGNGSSYQPDWSPDGTRLVFTHNREICTVNADGSELAQLTDSSTVEAAPGWSPDGSHIVFAVRQHTGNWDIYSMTADGSERQRLTHNLGSDWDPDWSPDGKWIVFALSLIHI